MKMDSITTYKAAEAYLLDIPKFTTKNSFADTKAFYEWLRNRGWGEEKLGKIIHVAGTNGKGSVCAYIRAIALAGGCRVAMFTSPHLISMRERFDINGAPVEEQHFLEALQWLERQLVLYHQEIPAYQPTFFERLFFMALYLFAQAAPDLTILETGLGGLLDTTNVIEHPAVSVITEIGLDHMQYLGHTIEEIAAQKAGIIKEQVPLVYVDKRESASVVIEEKARQKQAVCDKVSKDDYKINEIKKKSIDFSVYSRYYDYIRLSAETTASYQAENAAAAVRTMEVLRRQYGLEFFTEEVIREGIRRMKWRGRMEEILPQVYLDGAHNEDGVRAFIESVQQSRGSLPEQGSCYLMFSAVNDKEYDTMIKLLCGLTCVTQYYVTQIPGSRGTEIEELRQQFQQHTDKPVHVFEEVPEALAACLAHKGDKDVVYIVGSLYLAGMIEELIGKDAE